MVTNSKKVQMLFFALRYRKHLLRSLKGNLIELRDSELLQQANVVATDKGIPGHGYYRVYEQFLKDRRMQVSTLLEIGLLQHKLQSNSQSVYYDTPSLDMWHNYLPISQIIGFDIKKFNTSKDKRITIIQGDQKRRNDLQKIIDHYPEFDVIIDDGLHASEHQQVSLSYLFKCLNPGGIYFIEDLNYQPEEFEKDYIPKTKDVLKTLLSKGIWDSPVALNEEKKILESSVDAIYFFNSLKGRDIFKQQDALAAIVKKD